MRGLSVKILPSIHSLLKRRFVSDNAVIRLEQKNLKFPQPLLYYAQIQWAKNIENNEIRYENILSDIINTKDSRDMVYDETNNLLKVSLIEQNEYNDFIYTGIFSGSNFYLTKKSNYIVVSSLLDVSQSSDIVDIFGLEMPSEKFPLNVEIYDLYNLKKIKEFSFYDKIANQNLNFLYIQFYELSGNKLEIKFGILDTTKKIHAGIIDLETITLSIPSSHQY